jgi:hypothetical protein
MREQEVWIYVDIRVDDSYTPHKISIRAGTFHGDLHEVKWIELQQAKGWQPMVLTGAQGTPDEGSVFTFSSFERDNVAHCCSALRTDNRYGRI